MREFKGLYWRRHGTLRYFATRRYFGFSRIERYKRAGLTSGRDAP